MLSDLNNYRPAKIEFCLTDLQKETFKDVLTLFDGAKTSKEAIEVLKEKFNCLFPDGEVAMRKYDEQEITMIREEYCVKQENDAPVRKRDLEETLERIKAMKKAAEEAYNSVLIEIADLAARVKDGKTEFRLPATETVRIALNGYFLFYSWVDNVFQLCKAEKIPEWDRNSLWSQEDINRKAMLDVFGIEFPEVKKPVEEKAEENDELPFGEENE